MFSDWKSFLNLLNLRLEQSACGVAPQSLTVINRTVLYCQEKSFVFKLRFFVMGTTIDETLTDSFWGTPTTRQLSKDISPDNWMAKCLLCDFPLLFIVQLSLFSFVSGKISSEAQPISDYMMKFRRNFSSRLLPRRQRREMNINFVYLKKDIKSYLYNNLKSKGENMISDAFGGHFNRIWRCWL